MKRQFTYMEAREFLDINLNWLDKSVVWKPGLGAGHSGLDSLSQRGQVLTKVQYASLHGKKRACCSPGCPEQQPQADIA